MRVKIFFVILLALLTASFAATYITLEYQIKIKDELIAQKTLEIQNKTNQIVKLIKIINEKEEKLKYIEEKVSKIEKNLTKIETEIKKLSWNFSQWVYVVGVHDSKGAILILEGEIKMGKGRILIDLEKSYLDVSFQESLTKALEVINKVFSKKVLDKDIILKIKSTKEKRILVEGKSAGVALTVLLYALIEGKEINTSVVVTGAINSDGSVGQVGAIDAKAKAASKVATLFLVPQGQKPLTSPIEIKEISTIHDALKYMIKNQV